MRTGLRIVKKRKPDEVDFSELNGAYAWDTDWKIQDLNNIPRIVRGTIKDTRIYDEQSRHRELTGAKR